MFSILKGFLRKASLLMNAEKCLNMLLSVRFLYTRSVVLPVAQTAETIEIMSIVYSKRMQFLVKENMNNLTQ
ncbi:hypothetical protein SAMD00079811_32570 [Scytonema sp. HK-05]|nr:hypothetical protein NIES2130_22560 [Scytonema sp. HK-05]BAY45650.1 hypothetical protein SAMD00079811_32570 [Scytonema sp. HK-05]